MPVGTVHTAQSPQTSIHSRPASSHRLVPPDSFTTKRSAPSTRQGLAALGIGVLSTASPAAAMAVPQDTVLRTLIARSTPLLGPGTLVGEHPLFAVAGGLLGLVAGSAALKRTYDALPDFAKRRIVDTLAQVGRRLEAAGPYAGSGLLLATSAVACEEGVVRLAEAQHLVAAVLLLLALPTGLGGVQVLGRQLNIPILKEFLSAPVDFLDRHWPDIAGALLTTAGVASARFGQSLGAANLWSWPLMAAAIPASFGGLELIGREHGIPLVEECLTTPVRQTLSALARLLTSDGVVIGAGGLLTALGAIAGGQGVHHLASHVSSPLDALGAFEVSSGSVAAALGAGIVVHRMGKLESADKLFHTYRDLIAGNSFLSCGIALGKFSAASFGTGGLGYLNSLSAAAAAAMVSVSALTTSRQFAPKLTFLEEAMEPTVYTAAAAGAAMWTYLLAQPLAAALATSHPSMAPVLDLGPQGVAAAACFATSLGLLGSAFKQRWLERSAGKVFDATFDGVERAHRFASLRPVTTLAVLGAVVFAATRRM